jgi:hypothetical protein
MERSVRGESNHGGHLTKQLARFLAAAHSSEVQGRVAIVVLGIDVEYAEFEEAREGLGVVGSSGAAKLLSVSTCRRSIEKTYTLDMVVPRCDVFRGEEDPIPACSGCTMLKSCVRRESSVKGEINIPCLPCRELYTCLDFRDVQLCEAQYSLQNLVSRCSCETIFHWKRKKTISVKI